MFSESKTIFRNAVDHRGLTAPLTAVSPPRLTALLLYILLTFAILQTPLRGGLLYYSCSEYDNRNNEASCLAPGTYTGNLHSNGFFVFRYPLRINGFISTSQDRFIWEINPDNIHFQRQPLFNIPNGIPLPRSANWIRARARPWIGSENGRYMTRVWFQGEEGIYIYQYPLGLDPEDVPDLYQPVQNIVRRFHMPVQAFGAIFINGMAEIYGCVRGNLTVGTAGNMYLVDNIYYDGTDPATGDSINYSFPYMLGLVSERNIIIRSNEYNGRNNGYGRYEHDDTDHHSVTVTAGMAALNGTFTFEHQNHDWEAYQGPEPDERGIIHLRGSIVQYGGSNLYNGNHGGTGYNVDWKYDVRFDYGLPLFFDNIFGWSLYIGGSGIRRYYVISHAVVYANTICDYLTAGRGVEIDFRLSYRVLVRERLELIGTPDEPVLVGWENDINRISAVIAVDWGYYPKVRLKNVVFDEGIDLDCDADSIFIDSCRFGGEVKLRGRYVEVTNSTFNDEVTLDGYGPITFSHNLLKRGLVVDGNPRNCRIINNTILNPDGDGVFLDLYRSVELNSNIIACCERGIVKDHWNDVSLIYNDLYGNRDGDYIDCEPGEGSINADPRFEDMENGDYTLCWNSPCIDAGDPDLPPDPDGTRADIGAFYHHMLGVDNEALIPGRLDLTARPNPFNRNVVLSYNVNRPGDVLIEVYNLLGRVIVSDLVSASEGGNDFILSGDRLGGGGVYFVRLAEGERCGTVKVVYLP